MRSARIKQNDIIEIRQSEPYSYCQFVVGRDHPAFGRARHPFMTGSGGWSYFAATRFMLGIRPDFDRLVVDPCIPEAWDGFSVTRKWRGAEYRIRVENPGHVSRGVKGIPGGRKTQQTSPAAEGTADVEVIMG